MKRKNILHILKAFASSIIWGLGQLFNKQFIKALVFFLIFSLFLGIEVTTGDYFNTRDFDLYDTKIAGEYLGSEEIRDGSGNQSFSVEFPKWLKFNNINPNDTEWESFLSDNKFDTPSSKVDTDLILAFVGQRVRTLHDANTERLLAEAVVMATADAITYVENQATDTLRIQLGIPTATREDYPAEWQEIYDRIYPSVYPDRLNNRTQVRYETLYNNFMLEDELLSGLQDYFSLKSVQAGSNFITVSGDDWNETLLRIYFEAFPEEYKVVYDAYDNYFYERTGFFVKGIWSIVTLGQSPQLTVNGSAQMGFLMPNGKIPFSYVISGHNSTQLLLRGLISTLTLVFFLFIYVWNIKDAFKTSKAIQKGKRITEKEYFKNLYDNSFEYIVLTPAIILLTYISIMPIIFSFLIAFTNYNNQHIPPAQLVDWVGLKNFTSLFNIAGGSSIPFGDVFWKVLSWTLVWAVGATFTCFFGGFIQAVIINNKRVVFRKAWRAVLVLPWAIPALVSQLMFKVIFHGEGIVNKFLELAGINDLLRNVGALGKPMSALTDASATFMDRIIYMGDQSINWLGNEVNPWFVRIFIIVLNIWLGFPYFMALMSGVMTNISKELYEASEIDGATPFEQFKSITMPLVLYQTSPLLIMTFASNFNNFGMIYFISGGGPGGGNAARAYAGYTDILISWIYKLTTDDNIRWYSMASVFSILIFLIIGSISAWNFLRTKSFKEEDMM
ncbi:MAG: sugar ABC transporter permease [Acholeplasma sp.]|nr:sugar ABC transporter permease [Acholeplasma sp.]